MFTALLTFTAASKTTSGVPLNYEELATAIITKGNNMALMSSSLTEFTDNTEQYEGEDVYPTDALSASHTNETPGMVTIKVPSQNEVIILDYVRQTQAETVAETTAANTPEPAFPEVMTTRYVIPLPDETPDATPHTTHARTETKTSAEPRTSDAVTNVNLPKDNSSTNEVIVPVIGERAFYNRR